MTRNSQNNAAAIESLKAQVEGKAEPTQSAAMDGVLVVIRAEIAKLRAENEALKQAKAVSVKVKVSIKGAVSIYGLSRFPVTLYKEQVRKLIGMVPELEAFLKANDGQLRTKGEDDAAYARKLGKTPESYAKEIADAKAKYEG